MPKCHYRLPHTSNEDNLCRIKSSLYTCGTYKLNYNRAICSVVLTNLRNLVLFENRKIFDYNRYDGAYFPRIIYIFVGSCTYIISPIDSFQNPKLSIVPPSSKCIGFDFPSIFREINNVHQVFCVFYFFT